MLFRSVSKLTEFSQRVAEAVGQCALDQKLNREDITDIKSAIEKIKWTPKY